MNTEQHEHRVSEIIRKACEELGVRIVSEPFMDSDEQMHIANTYDRASEILRLRDRSAYAMMVGMWISGASVGVMAAWQTNLATFFSVLIPLSIVCALAANRLHHWMHREPISENDLNWHIRAALIKEGYVVQFQGNSMRVWWNS